MRVEVEYAIVALGLSAKEIAAVIEDATGRSVDHTPTTFLNTLDSYQLKVIWKRLSTDRRWKRRQSSL
jgi:hypothetical protein